MDMGPSRPAQSAPVEKGRGAFSFSPGGGEPVLEVGLGVSSSIFFSLTYIFSRLATRELSPLLGGLIVSATIALSFFPWVVFAVPATEFRNPSLL
jgi:hypothetical protein